MSQGASAEQRLRELGIDLGAGRGIGRARFLLCRGASSRSLRQNSRPILGYP